MENKQNLGLIHVCNYEFFGYRVKLLATENEADFCLYNPDMNEDDKKVLFLILNSKTIIELLRHSFSSVAEGMKSAFESGLFVEGKEILPECDKEYPNTKVFYLDDLLEGITA